MDEADELPFRDQFSLTRNDALKESSVGVRRVGSIRIVTGDYIVRQLTDSFRVTTHREELKGADADMARRDAGQHRSGQGRFAPDRLSGGDDGEGLGRGDAEREHGLADDVFAQDRPECRATVAVARERRGTGALQLDVAAHALDVDNLTKENGS